MTELFEPTSDADWRLTRGGAGLLATFNVPGLLDASDVHVADRVGELGGEDDERVLLAVALAVRAVRRGSVCLDLATVPESAPTCPGRTRRWQAAVEASPLVAAGVVRWELDLLYLDRYHRLETQVCDDLRGPHRRGRRRRSTRPGSRPPPTRLRRHPASASSRLPAA